MYNFMTSVSIRRLGEDIYQRYWIPNIVFDFYGIPVHASSLTVVVVTVNL